MVRVRFLFCFLSQAAARRVAGKEDFWFFWGGVLGFYRYILTVESLWFGGEIVFSSFFFGKIKEKWLRFGGSIPTAAYKVGALFETRRIFPISSYLSPLSTERKTKDLKVLL